MKTVILGAGRRGLRLASRLSEENTDVILIDENPDKVDEAMAKADCLALCGNGTDIESMKRLDIADADAFISITESDDTNLVSAAIAATQLGIANTIAVIRDVSYSAESLLGITHLVNTSKETAQRILTEIEHGIYSDMISFEDSDLHLFNVILDDSVHLAGLSVKEVKRQIEGDFLIAAICRDSGAIVPSGDTVLRKGDILSIATTERQLSDVIKRLGTRRKKPNKIVISGASRISDLLLSLMTPSARKGVVLVEKDASKCRIFAEKYSEILVLNADITEENLLYNQGVDNCDLILCLTDNDELNLVIAASNELMDIQSSLAIVAKNPSYVRMAGLLDIDSIISIQDETCDSIIEHLRGAATENIHSLFDGDVEVFDFKVTDDLAVCRQALKDINLKGKAVIAAVINRDGATTIPSGAYTIDSGDRLILIAEHQNTASVLNLFRTKAAK